MSQFEHSSVKWRIDALKNAHDLHASILFEDLEKEIKLYFDRYECVRILNVPQYKQIMDRNMKGERFDDIIDKMVINKNAE